MPYQVSPTEPEDEASQLARLQKMTVQSFTEMKRFQSSLKIHLKAYPDSVEAQRLMGLIETTVKELIDGEPKLKRFFDSQEDVPFVRPMASSSLLSRTSGFIKGILKNVTRRKR